MAEDRLDRIERNLERHAEESNQRMTRLERHAKESNQRMTRLERFLANFSKNVARNAADANERMDRTDKQIAQLSSEISFLRAAVQGHASQSTPPAHQK